MADLDFNTLVNRDNLLPRDYIPTEMYVIDDNSNNIHNYQNPNLKPMLRKDIKPFIDALLGDAKKAGFNIVVDSGYRSFDYQAEILSSCLQAIGEEAYDKVAVPGASEHQTGLAFDIAYMNNNEINDRVLATDPEVKWMKDNAHKYGFILRYPEGKENITGYAYEPWHYRFVGYGLARLLHDEKITLEEYYYKYLGPIKKR